MGIESKARRRVIARFYCEPEQRGYRCAGPAKKRNLQPFEVYLLEIKDQVCELHECPIVKPCTLWLSIAQES